MTSVRSGPYITSERFDHHQNWRIRSLFQVVHLVSVSTTGVLFWLTPKLTRVYLPPNRMWLCPYNGTESCVWQGAFGFLIGDRLMAGPRLLVPLI